MRLGTAIVLAMAFLAWSVRAQEQVVEVGSLAIRVETLAGGLEHPWSLAFLPDGRMLVTERLGRLRVVARDGSVLAAISDVPSVLARGRGGLLDVALGPDFSASRLVYLAYAEPGPGGGSTAAARARLSEKFTRVGTPTLVANRLLSRKWIAKDVCDAR